MPRKIASVKKANPSSEKGMETSGPACFMKVGKRRPSSKERTVPDTAPTAKRTAAPFDQRFARSRYSGSRVRSQRSSASTIRSGSAIPIAAKTMWKASDTAIWARAKRTSCIPGGRRAARAGGRDPRRSEGAPERLEEERSSGRERGVLHACRSGARGLEVEPPHRRFARRLSGHPDRLRQARHARLRGTRHPGQ